MNNCEGYIIVIPHEEIVSHGECNLCGKKIILPDENYLDFIKMHGKLWPCNPYIITKYDIHEAIKDYKKLREHAIKLKKENKLFGKFNELAFSEIIRDVQVMKYYPGYKKEYKGYVMTFIFDIGYNKKLLIYEHKER